MTTASPDPHVGLPSEEVEALRLELDRLEAAAPLSARETARYLEAEARLLELESAFALAEGKEG